MSGLFMYSNENNHAFIDGANLHKGIEELGWKLDYARFRRWLSEKYRITQAYIFIGFIPNNKDLYNFLRTTGFTLVFKETTCDHAGKIKGNCDADLVLRAAAEYYEKKFDNAVIVASDGDYVGPVNFLKARGVFRSLISPSNKCSFLLRKLNISIVYLDHKRSSLGYVQKEKAPGGDRTPRGSFS